MAEAEVAAATAGGADEQRPQRPGLLQMILRGVLMYQVMQFVTGKGGWGKGGGGEGGAGGAAGNGGILVPGFDRSDFVDMYMYIDMNPGMEGIAEAEMVWQEDHLPLGMVPQLSRTIEVETGARHETNATLYVHTVFSRSGSSPDPSSDDFERLSIFGVSTPIVVYRPFKKKVERKNLLAASDGDGEGDDEKEVKGELEEIEKEVIDDDKPWLAYFKPNITVNIIDDYTRYKRNQIPAPVIPHLVVDEETQTYTPILFANDFWLLKEKYIQLNETSPDFHELHLSLGGISTIYWQFMQQMEQSFKMQEGFGSMNAGESDELKRVFMEGNPWLLALTGLVSLLHTVFDMLAFRSDIGFWRQNKSMEGLSARMVILNSFMQLVIFLYLLDNDTSYVVLFSSGIGTLIEFWKITKCMTITVSWRGSIPSIKFEDKAGYTETKTKQYDREASVYLGYVLGPLVVAYSVYALLYDTHKSWYAWVLNSLVGAVYTFGFIMMCPQLYINYKLKSVAHLPWRQMTYKFLNTIIDDLFAFVIKMPLLHRISVFRDDVIFFIYIYQRWIYPVDKKRVNEFGFSGEKPEDDKSEADGKQIEGKAEGQKEEEEEEEEAKKDK